MEMPEGRIFIIPARLEDCELPFGLKKYQAVNLYEKAGYTKLMQALKLRASQLERATVELPKKGETTAEIKKVIEEKKPPEPKEEKPETKTPKPSQDKVGVGGDVKDSIIVSGSGNVINFGEQKKPAPEKLQPKKTKPSRKPNTAIIVAVVGLVGTIIAALIGSPIIENLPSPSLHSTESATATTTLTSEEIIPSKTIEPSVTPIAVVAVMSTQALTDEINNLAYFEIDINKKCELVFVDKEKNNLPCPDSSPSLYRFFSWSPTGDYAIISNVGYYLVTWYYGPPHTESKSWVYIQPVNQGESFLFKTYPNYGFYFEGYWFDDNTLFYAFSENGLAKIGEVDVESRTERVVAKTPSGIWSYDVSPSLDKVAYISSPGKKIDIFVGDTQMSEVENITETSNIEVDYSTSVHWINDDALIFDSPNNDLFLYSILNKSIEQIGNGRFLSISPDRTEMLYFSGEIKLYNFSRKSLVELPKIILESRGSTFFDTNWSPDSRYFSVVDRDGIFVIDLVNNTVSQIQGQFEAPYDLVWSQNNVLAFVSVKDDRSEVYVSSVDGSQVLKISEEGNAYAPAWVK